MHRLLAALAVLPLAASDGGFLFAQQESNPRALHNPLALASKSNPFAAAANAGGVLVHPDTYSHLTKSLTSAQSGHVSVVLEVMRSQPSAIWIDARRSQQGRRDAPRLDARRALPLSLPRGTA